LIAAKSAGAEFLLRHLPDDEVLAPAAIHPCRMSLRRHH
jgi:hypothetical protein